MGELRSEPSEGWCVVLCGVLLWCAGVSCDSIPAYCRGRGMRVGVGGLWDGVLIPVVVGDVTDVVE